MRNGVHDRVRRDLATGQPGSWIFKGGPDVGVAGGHEVPVRRVGGDRVEVPGDDCGVVGRGWAGQQFPGLLTCAALVTGLVASVGVNAAGDRIEVITKAMSASPFPIRRGPFLSPVAV